MEIARYVNGVSISEKELSNIKTVTREMAEAVNEARRRAQSGAASEAGEVKADG